MKEVLQFKGIICKSTVGYGEVDSGTETIIFINKQFVYVFIIILLLINTYTIYRQNWCLPYVVLPSSGKTSDDIGVMVDVTNCISSTKYLT